MVRYNANEGAANPPAPGQAKAMEKIGVLALQGGVEEHINALMKASDKLGVPVQAIEVRTASDTSGMDGIILPGGESTAISKLMEREGLFEPISRMRKIMGTCAGAILLAKKVDGATDGQRFLSLMDISIERNAYGSQHASFEAHLSTKFGNLTGVFIRAPKLSMLSMEARPLAFHGDLPVAAYQQSGERHYLACAFHPELTTTKFHEFFIKL